MSQIDRGLTGAQLALLCDIFKKHLAIESVKLYGSRAKSTFHARSDVDLVVFGAGIDRFLIAELLLELMESDLPYTVDLQNYHDLKHRTLIEHIDRLGRVIYTKRDFYND